MLSRLSLSADTILPRALRPDDTPSGSAGQQQSTASRDAKHSAHTVQDVLELWLRQQYLELELAGGPQQNVNARTKRKAPTTTRGMRRQRDGEQPEESYEWRWGARAEAEVSEQLIASFAIDIMAAQDEMRLYRIDAGGSLADDAEGGEEQEEEEDEEEEAPRRGGRAPAKEKVTPLQRAKAIEAQQKKIRKLRETTYTNIERSAGSALVGSGQ